MAFAACGNSISVADLPAELEDAQCDYLVRCQGIVDSASCHANLDLAGDPDFQSILDAIDDGTIKYDEDKAGECADSFSDRSCEFTGFFDSEDPCEGVFTGTVQLGGACVVDLQCAGDAECEPTNPDCDTETMCCPSTCVAGDTVIESPAGGPCGDDTHVCADNLYCHRISETVAMCEAPITQEGAACEQLSACANPMYCNLDLFGSEPGTCKRPAASGAACVVDDLLPCADGRDYCDPTTLKCTREVAPGGTCGEGINCVGYASCINSQCVADVQQGGACVVDGDGADCASGLDCIGGTCQVANEGVACSL